MRYVSAYPVGGQPPAGYVPAPPPGAYGGEFLQLYAGSSVMQLCLDSGYAERLSESLL